MGHHVQLAYRTNQCFELCNDAADLLCVLLLPSGLNNLSVMPRQHVDGQKQDLQEGAGGLKWRNTGGAFKLLFMVAACINRDKRFGRKRSSAVISSHNRAHHVVASQECLMVHGCQEHSTCCALAKLHVWLGGTTMLQAGQSSQLC